VTTQPTSQCATCLHFVSPFARPDRDFSAPASCPAFPAGIPDEVYENVLDHPSPGPSSPKTRSDLTRTT